MELREKIESTIQEALSSQWVSVEERLPKLLPHPTKREDLSSGWLLVRNGKSESYYTACYNGRYWHRHNGRKLTRVTHWMKIPEL